MAKIKGLLDIILEFLNVLRNMEKKGKVEEIRRGEFIGPFGKRATYEFKIKIGLKKRRR